MTNKTLLSQAIATAAAIAFTAAPISSAVAKGETGDIKCFGSNNCKGLSECKTATNGCKGENSCKGKGYTMVSSEQACIDAGGRLSEN